MDDELDFGEYLGMIRKHWIWALLSFVIVLGAVVAYTYLSDPVYETKSLILLTNQDEANFALGSSAAPKTPDLETQRVILESPSVMNPIYIKYGKDTFKLSTSIIKNSNIIEITVEANSAENAVIIANEISESYVNYTSNARVQDAENNIDFITDKIAAYDKELNLLDLESAYYKNNTALTRQEKLEYQTIQREITAKTKIYDYLLTKKEEAEITANSKSTNLKIVQYAEMPEAPVKPNKELNIALGIILALGAAIGSAIFANSIIPDKKQKKERA